MMGEVTVTEVVIAGTLVLFGVVGLFLYELWSVMRESDD